jgi:hypothetical protein
MVMEVLIIPTVLCIIYAIPFGDVCPAGAHEFDTDEPECYMFRRIICGNTRYL